MMELRSVIMTGLYFLPLVAAVFLKRKTVLWFALVVCWLLHGLFALSVLTPLLPWLTPMSRFAGGLFLVSFCITTGLIYILLAYRQSNLLFVLLPVAILMSALTSVATPLVLSKLPLLPKGNLLIVHVATFFSGIGAFFVAAIFGTLLLFQNRCLKKKIIGGIVHFLPSIQTLDVLMLRFMVIGFPLLTLGLIGGLMLAHGNWQNVWGSDPQVLLAFSCWFWYALILQMRFLWGLQGRRLAILNIFGFTVMLFAWLGVYSLFPSLTHSQLLG